MFTDYPELISASVFGLRIDMAVFPIIGFQMVSTNFFTSIGMAKKAIFLSLTRQMLFLVPGLIILPPFLGTFGVWLSIPIADAAAVVVTSVVFIRQIQKFKAIQ
jgi:Na+-driven multidrug efflux pump